MASPNPEGGMLLTQQRMEASTNTASQDGGQIEISGSTMNMNKPTSQDQQSSGSQVPPNEGPAARFDHTLTQADLDQLVSWKPDYSRYPKPEAVLKRMYIPVSQWSEYRYHQWLITTRAHEIPPAGITDGLSLIKYVHVWGKWIADEKDPARARAMMEKIHAVFLKLHEKIGEWDTTVTEFLRSGIHSEDFIRDSEAASYGSRDTQPGEYHVVRHAHTRSDGLVSYLPNEVPIRESIETDDVNGVNGAPMEGPSHTVTANSQPSHRSSKPANKGGSLDGARTKLQRQEHELEKMEEQYAGGDTVTKTLLDANLKKKRKRVANLRKQVTEQELSLVEETPFDALSHDKHGGRMDIGDQEPVAEGRTRDSEDVQEKNNEPPTKRQRTDVSQQQLPAKPVPAKPVPAKPVPAKPVPAKPVASQSGPSKPTSVQANKVSRQHLIQTFLPALNTVLQQNRQKTVAVSAVSTWTLVDHMFMRYDFWPNEKETLKRIYFAEFGGEDPAIGDTLAVTPPKEGTGEKADKKVKTSGKKATTTQTPTATNKPAAQVKTVMVKQEPKPPKAGTGGSQGSAKGQKRKRLDNDDDDSDYHPSR